MLYFDCPNRVTANGLTGFELAMRMAACLELAQTRKAAKLSNIHTGPATRAKILVKKWKKRGYRPSYAPERNHRFISGVSDAGYGASSHMDSSMIKAIKKQDSKRKNRLMSEKMHRLTCLTNFNHHDTDLALPGATEVTIVSIAATRALGYAPQIEPPALIPLTCKYNMGDRVDMAIELD